MSKVSEGCVAILTGALGFPKDAAEKHLLTRHVLELERNSKRARFVYPIVYLVMGLILALIVTQMSTKTDTWNKLFGAVVGVFSALLAFWKPSIELSQSDCEKFLEGKKLATTDIQELNRLLAIPTKDFENIIKLISAGASFVAIYLLTR